MTKRPCRGDWGDRERPFLGGLASAVQGACSQSLVTYWDLTAHLGPKLHSSLAGRNVRSGHFNASAAQVHAAADHGSWSSDSINSHDSGCYLLVLNLFQE